MKKAYRVIVMLMLTSITHVWSAESDSDESLDINFFDGSLEELEKELKDAQAGKAAQKDAEIAALIKQVQAPIQSATASAATSGNNSRSKAFILPIYSNPLQSSGTAFEDDSCVRVRTTTPTHVPLRTTRSQTNKKPFVCNYQVKVRGSLEMKTCDRSFASNEELIEHKLIHSSKPFVCEYKCGSSFSEASDRKKHYTQCENNPDLDADEQPKNRIKKEANTQGAADVVLPIPVPLPNTITQEDINALQEKIDEVRERIQEIKRQKILNSIPIPSVPTVGEQDAQ